MAESNGFPRDMKAAIVSLEEEISKTDNRYRGLIQDIEKEIDQNTTLHYHTLATSGLELLDIERRKINFLRHAVTIGTSRLQWEETSQQDKNPAEQARWQDSAKDDANFIQQADEFKKTFDEWKELREEQLRIQVSFREFCSEREARIRQVEVEAKTTKLESESRLAYFRKDYRLKRDERRRTAQRLREELAAVEKELEEDEDPELTQTSAISEVLTAIRAPQKDIPQNTLPTPLSLPSELFQELNFDRQPQTSGVPLSNTRPHIPSASQDENSISQTMKDNGPICPTNSTQPQHSSSHHQTNAGVPLHTEQPIPPSEQNINVDKPPPPNMLSTPVFFSIPRREPTIVPHKLPISPVMSNQHNVANQMDPLAAQVSAVALDGAPPPAVATRQQVDNLTLSEISASLPLSIVQHQVYGAPYNILEMARLATAQFASLQPTHETVRSVDSVERQSPLTNTPPISSGTAISIEEYQPLPNLTTNQDNVSDVPSLPHSLQPSTISSKPGHIHKPVATSDLPAVGYVATPTLETSPSPQYRSPSSSPLTSVDGARAISPSVISASPTPSSRSPSPAPDKPSSNIVFDHVNGIYTDPPCMKGVPLRKITEQDQYWEEKWHNTARYNSFESEARKNSGKLAFFDEPECPIHPNQILAKPFIEGQGLVDKNYSDAIKRIVETLIRSGRTMEQAIQWLRNRLAQLHQEKGVEFALKSTLIKFRTQDKEYVPILEAYPKDPPASTKPRRRPRKSSGLQAKSSPPHIASKNGPKGSSQETPSFPQLFDRQATASQKTSSSQIVTESVPLAQGISIGNAKRKLPESLTTPSGPKKRPRLDDIYDHIPEDNTAPFIRSRNHVHQRQSPSGIQTVTDNSITAERDPQTAPLVTQQEFQTIDLTSDVSESPTVVSPQNLFTAGQDAPPTRPPPANAPESSKVSNSLQPALSAEQNSPRVRVPSAKASETSSSNFGHQRSVNNPQKKRAPYIAFSLLKIGSYGGEKKRYQLRLDGESRIFEPYQQDIDLSPLNPELVINPQMVTELSFETLCKQGDSVVVEHRYYAKDKENIKKPALTNLTFREIGDADRFAGFVLQMKPKLQFKNEVDRLRIEQRLAKQGQHKPPKAS